MTLREQLERNRSRADVDLKKAQVQVQLVLPVLLELGWDSSDSSQLDVERLVEANGTSGTVDVVLLGPSGEVVAHVDFAPRGTDLPPLAVHTLALAARGTAQYAVVTDGIVWNLYFRDPANDSPHVIVASLDLVDANVDQAVKELTDLIGRYSIVQGHAQSSARRLLQSRRSRQLLQDVPRVLAELIAEPNERLVKLIQERIEQESSWSPDTGEIAAALKRSQGDVGKQKGTSSPVVDPSLSESVAESVGKTSAWSLTRFVGSHQKSPPAAPPRVFTIGHERIAVDAWNDMLFRVAEFMYRSYPSSFAQVLDWRGPTRNYVDRDPSRMPDYARPKEIGDSGFFLDMNWSADACVERAEELLEMFGYRAEDLVLEWS